MKWPIVKLGEVVAIKGGGTPDKSIPEYWGGNIPWASVKDFKAYELKTTIDRITEEGVAASATQIIPAGNIIVPTRMAVGKAAINMLDLAINQDLKAIFAGPKIDRKFLLHALLANADTLIRQATGATVKGIKVEVLKNLEIPLPPLEEQKRIAGILDQADALRRMRARALEKLNTLGQAVFQEMFGEELSRQPNESTQKIGDLCHRLSVGVVIKPASYYVNEGVPAIRGTNIKPQGIDLKDVVYFSESDSEGPLKKSVLRKGDVVAVRSGRPGLAAVVPEELDGANSIDILFSTPNTEKLLPRFLCDFMNSPIGKQKVFSESRGQVQQHFNVKSWSETEINLPSLKRQMVYADKIADIEEQIVLLEAASGRAEATFASLQSAAFQGKLQPTPASRPSRRGAYLSCLCRFDP